MSTKINPLAAQFVVDPVQDFPIQRQTGISSTDLDPNLTLDDQHKYIFGLIYEKLNQSRIAAGVHIKAMNSHQAALNEFLRSESASRGIVFTSDIDTSDYVFNMDIFSFIPKSFPKSKGGIAPDPDPASVVPAPIVLPPVK